MLLEFYVIFLTLIPLAWIDVKMVWHIFDWIETNNIQYNTELFRSIIYRQPYTLQSSLVQFRREDKPVCMTIEGK